MNSFVIELCRYVVGGVDADLLEGSSTTGCVDLPGLLPADLAMAIATASPTARVSVATTISTFTAVATWHLQPVGLSKGPAHALRATADRRPRRPHKPAWDARRTWYTARQVAISKHLGVLSREGLVARRKQGNFSSYSIAEEGVFALCEDVCGSLRARLDALREVVGSEAG